MRFRSQVVVSLVLVAGVSMASAQLASSHASTLKKAPAASENLVQPSPTEKPAVKVNGTVLTQTDVIREMYTIFPYARQHNGFPKNMEPEIRRGATEMLIFEELVYQEAKRRNMTIPAERLAKSEKAFRSQFPDKASYDHFLRAECKGSPAVLRERIRRSLLIDKFLMLEVEQKSTVTAVEAKSFYDKNPKQFDRPETVAIQTISILPPKDASPATLEENKKKIKDAARLAKATKTSREFGLIAEQISEDDWHINLGDRGTVAMASLPPEVQKVLQGMKLNEVSDPIALGTAWVVVRLNAHDPAGRVPFAKIKTKLMSDLQKEKRVEVRGALNKKLRTQAKVEIL